MGKMIYFISMLTHSQWLHAQSKVICLMMSNVVIVIHPYTYMMIPSHAAQDVPSEERIASRGGVYYSRQTGAFFAWAVQGLGNK